MTYTRVALVGFSGTGKSTVARLLAERLEWACIDMDERIEAHYGLTVPEIFATHGEASFRATERSVLVEALGRERAVVATGGGAVAAPETWEPDLLGDPATLVVTLDAQPETMLRRLKAQQANEGEAVERPMLAGDDPLGRIADLKHRRQAAYDRAGVTLIVDEAPAQLVAEEVAGLVNQSTAASAPSITLSTPSGFSAIHIGPGVAQALGELARRRWPAARRAWVVSDEHVAALHEAGVTATLAEAGFDVRARAVPVGEESKSLAVAGQLYDWLLDAGVERGDVMVALGGGVIGDLVGFVAATCLRGIGLVQVPTSLLAMVDSSVGGKTGINHRAGKNLIGAFYQPPLVVIDAVFLRTLPPHVLSESWAEVVKHAVIQRTTPGGERGDLLSFLERNRGALTALREPATSYLIQRNVALKAAVVAEDEREAGLRTILNFGHTLGHAIEAAGYRYLHGEAVAVGMRAAAWIGMMQGTCDEAVTKRLEGLLDQFGLPQTADIDPERVLALLGSDKKRAAGRQRWVLPLTEGGVCVRDDVPDGVVRKGLSAVCS